MASCNTLGAGDVVDVLEVYTYRITGNYYDLYARLHATINHPSTGSNLLECACVFTGEPSLCELSAGSLSWLNHK